MFEKNYAVIRKTKIALIIHAVNLVPAYKAITRANGKTYLVLQAFVTFRPLRPELLVIITQLNSFYCSHSKLIFRGFKDSVIFCLH